MGVLTSRRLSARDLPPRYLSPGFEGFFAADRDPERGRTVPVDATTTPRRLVIRTMWGANRFTIPALVLISIHFIGEAMVPLVMGLAIDRAIATHDLGSLLWWLPVLAVVFLVLSVSWRFGDRLALYARAVIEHQFRMRLTDRMLDPRGTDGPARLPGTALSIATSDVMRLSAAVFLAIFPVGELAAVVTAGVILLWISWPLGLAVLLGAPLLLWILDRAGGPLRERTAAQQEFVGRAAGTAADLIAGFRVLKGIGAEAEAAQRYRAASTRARDAAISATRTEGIYIGLLALVSSMFVIAVGVAAGIMAVQGHLGLGELITVVGLTQFIMGPLNALGTNFGAVWNSAVPSAQRVLSVLQAGPAVEVGEVDTASGPLRIRLPDVVGAPVSDIEIQDEGITVIVADQPSGTALARLLAREERPSGGAVGIGDTDLFDLEHSTARRTVRVVPHTPHLFEGTVWDNIVGSSGAEHSATSRRLVADADADVDVARIEQAMFASVCEDVIEVLPRGVDTPVGEAGRLLSGGQRQRVGLARAVAARSSYLVLQDPTTAVDSVTEAEVARRIAVARTGSATVVLTSSPAWLGVADHVITLTDAAIGSPVDVGGREARR